MKKLWISALISTSILTLTAFATNEGEPKDERIHCCCTECACETCECERGCQYCDDCGERAYCKFCEVRHCEVGNEVRCCHKNEPRRDTRYHRYHHKRDYRHGGCCRHRYD